MDDMRFRTIVRGAARWGALCGVFAVLVFVVGCPFVPGPDACSDNPCDDEDLCTIDTCVDVDGEPVCTNAPAQCDPGLVCNPADGECVACLTDADCAQGFCAQGAGYVCVECILDTHCDDGNDCTTDVCNASVCTHTNVADGTACADDGNECTDDVCDTGVCDHPPVADDTACTDDGNECTDDVCAAGVCDHPPVADGTTCDDGDICTEDDMCTAGVCDGTDIAGCCETDADCDAGQTCDTATNQCESACEIDADCDDDNLCTTDDCTVDGCTNTPVTCGAGEKCNPATGNCEEIECTTNADCDDGASCTVDTCQLSTGACKYLYNDDACDDGQYCTGVETCDPSDADAEAGTGCVIPGNPCIAAGKICNEADNSCDDCTSNAQCDDDAECTQDTCAAGTCVFNPDDGFCDDGLFCTADDFCDPEHADADADGCVNEGTPCDCGDLAPGECGAGAVAGDYLLCDENANDGNGGCLPCTGEASCNDGVPCTVDVCNAAGPRYCSNTPSDAACPDPLFCDGEDLCQPDDEDADFNGCVPQGNPCDGVVELPICDEVTNACKACQSNADCSAWIGVDEDACTATLCNVAGQGRCSNEDIICDDPATDCPSGCNAACDLGGFCTDVAP